jgi:glutamyl-tRNA reductase
MSIEMIGIDHSNATIAERELFSFTKKQCVQAMLWLKEQKGIAGVILISTCNRTEIWISVNEEYNSSLYELICQIKEARGTVYKNLFVERQEEEAIWHLFHLACGLESRILGEDQIITQVKDSLSLARENYCTDNVLEVLFRKAITAAKKVKAEVKLNPNNASVIHTAMVVLKENGHLKEKMRCLVIGNGEMGQITANVLKSAGMHVTVTVRQYRSGIVKIPLGCERIHYGERFTYLPECDLIVSATASPNYTITKEQIRQLDLNKDIIMVDLAVPRDIEPSLAEVKNIMVYDIDDFQIDGEDEELKKSIIETNYILEKYIKEYLEWYSSRDIIININEVSSHMAKDFELRMEHILQKLCLEDTEKKVLKEKLEIALQKTVHKNLFGLKDNVNDKIFRECIDGMHQIYQEKKVRNPICVKR